MTRRLTAGTCALLALSLAAAAQVPQNATAPTRTGMIVGQVVDGTTGAPVGEAVVRLVLQGQPEDAPDPAGGRVIADPEGRFFFGDLPAGRYYLQAAKDGYASGGYAQRRPSSQTLPLTLGASERRADVQLRVWKYAVIGGTVLDEAGEPVVGIVVRAIARDVVAGRVRFGSMQFVEGPTAVTDDRGMFRLAQLTPGTYVVVVPSTQTTLPAAALANPGAALRNELFWGGVHEMTPLGQPRTVQIGDFALMTLNRVVIPPPPGPDGRMQVYRPTFFPSAATAGAATPITVRSGEERTDLTITLTPVPAARVSGRLITPDGSVPPSMMIRLDGAATADVVTRGLVSGPDYVGLETATGLSDAQGRFTLLGVPPGDYIVRQGNRFLARPIQQGDPSYWLSQPITVGRQDIDDLAIDLRPAIRVEGRLEFRGSTGAEAPPPLVGVVFETPFGEQGQFAAEVNRQSYTFATYASGGRYIVRASQPGAWVVQSVTLDGKDITDRAFDLQSDATSVVVTYTDRRTTVSGSVRSADGAPADTAVVLVFPVDRQGWSGYGTSPRTLAIALTTDAGVYTFEHLPPGEYHVVAVDASEVDGWRDPERLEALATQATRLNVAAGDALKTLDLRVRTGR